MFILVNILGHPVELPGLVQICCRSGVDWKVAKWCAVVCALCQSSLLKVEVMRRAEEKDTLAVLSVSVSDLAFTGMLRIGWNISAEAKLEKETITSNHSRLAYIPGLVCVCGRRTRVREASMSEGVHVSARPIPLSVTHRSYGPMMTLAPGTGSWSTCWPSVRGPIHVTGVFTSSSQPSS